MIELLSRLASKVSADQSTAGQLVLDQSVASRIVPDLSAASQLVPDQSAWRTVLEDTCKVIIKVDVGLFAVSIKDLHKVEWSKGFLALFDQVLGLGLVEEAGKLATVAFPPLPASDDLFWLVWLPILRFTKGLVKTLDHESRRQTNISPMAARFIGLVLQRLAESLALRRPIRPEESDGWKRNPPKALMDCPCPSCASVCQFILSSDRPFGRFSYGELTCNHLLKRLNHPSVRGEYDIVKPLSNVGTALEMTKTNDHKGRGLIWTEECDLIKGHIEQMPRDCLKDLLGKDYERLTNLPVAIAEAFAIRKAALAVPQAVSNDGRGQQAPLASKRVPDNRAAGVKRKHT